MRSHLLPKACKWHLLSLSLMSNDHFEQILRMTMMLLDTYMQYLPSIICLVCYVFLLKLYKQLKAYLLMLLQKNSGVDTFFTYDSGMKDCITDVEFMGSTLTMLNKVNNEQHSRQILSGLRQMIH